VRSADRQDLLKKPALREGNRQPRLESPVES
jgi:hypothetical protein